MKPFTIAKGIKTSHKIALIEYYICQDVNAVKYKIY